VGQRSATETLFGIVAAFVEQPTWSQAELARRLETRPETIRRYLTELAGTGFKLTREEERPHVYWSVSKGWLPGALVFSGSEARDLVRLLGRGRKSPLRERILKIAIERLAQSGQAVGEAPVAAPALGEEEEKWLGVVEDAAVQKRVLKMRYFTASRGKEAWRSASVHRVDVGARPHFVATCHVNGDLRRFRVSNILDARLDQGERFRALADGELSRFDVESLAGFRDEGPVRRCVFFVRDPEAAWVERNLPDERISARAAPGGTRFEVATSALVPLARFVVGLGDAARCETEALAAEVATIARGALGRS